MLPPETLWKAARWIREEKVFLSLMDSEPTTEEVLGLIISISRRQKKISHIQLTRKIGCSLDELMALEAGALPREISRKYFGKICHVLNMKPSEYPILFDHFKSA